jgi:hypothetical protein
MKKIGSANLTKVAVAVGLYDTIIGLWPFLSMNSFTALTGLDSNLDAVRMIGAAWSVLGAMLLISCKKSEVVPVLGVASTLAGSMLALTECSLVAMKLIPVIFLLQAICEVIIGRTWIKTLTAKMNTINFSRVTNPTLTSLPR